VAYVMLDLQRYYPVPDVRRFVYDLEEWIIRSLATIGIAGERRAGRIGIWVVLPNQSEAKVAALGIRIRRGVTFHGIAINVNPNLAHYDGIIPCGITEYGVTSLEKLGNSATMENLDQALKAQFYNIFRET
jgi:lipoyl(octanoyl) transferase